MSWNYRVFRRHDPAPPPGFETEDELVIHEAYYANPGDEIPEGWTVRNVAPSGENLEELRGCLLLMLQALDKPILDEDDIETVQGGGHGVHVPDHLSGPAR